MAAQGIDAALRALTRLSEDEDAHRAVSAGADVIIRSLRSGGHLYACGNGGSMCEATHLAQELSGRYLLDREPLRAAAISDAAHITATGNDYGFEHIFERYIRAHARKGDVLVAISVSGESPNVLRASHAAKELGSHVVALTDSSRSSLARVSDVAVCVNAGGLADRVQELHVLVVHLLVEAIERALCPHLYEGRDAG